MRTKQPQDCANEQMDCDYIADERNSYFTGKYLTARDFADEQAYFLSRHRLHNRLLHGWGIVCGLRVVRHPNPDCRRRWVVVHPGIALDCCGRELILKCETPFELPLPRPEEEQGNRYARQETPDQQTGDEGDVEEMREPFLLVLRYAEEKTEEVPVLYNEGHGDPKRKEANRIRETAVLDVVRLEDVEGNCWLNPEGDPDARCRDDCDDDLPGPGNSCLSPGCPCGEVVPLALIKPGYSPEDPFEIDMLGRRYLPTPPELLTHIVDTNWTHGGEVSIEELNYEMNRRLTVRFDRKLLQAYGDSTGVSPFTFIVQYGGIQNTLEFLPSEFDPTVEDDCLAVFTIDPDYVEVGRRRDRRERRSIAGTLVYVTLKCNFILDCHNNPVDGDFLRARFPTGDGVPGGVFESWFRVTDRYDREYNGRDENREEE
jgi:hypothetical protein